MYVPAGASNSCSVPSGSTSLTLYTEDPDVLEPEPAFKPNDFETLFTDPSEHGLFRKALLALARCVVLSLQAPSSSIILPALRAVGNIVTGDGMQTQGACQEHDSLVQVCKNADWSSNGD
nr:importin subunit alpha-2-like isoform X1 [Ipomoea batatas]